MLIRADRVKDRPIFHQLMFSLGDPEASMFSKPSLTRSGTDFFGFRVKVVVTNIT